MFFTRLRRVFFFIFFSEENATVKNVFLETCNVGFKIRSPLGCEREMCTVASKIVFRGDLGVYNNITVVYLRMRGWVRGLNPP